MIVKKKVFNYVSNKQKQNMIFKYRVIKLLNYRMIKQASIYTFNNNNVKSNKEG